jgi:hypothetical protein
MNDKTTQENDIEESDKVKKTTLVIAIFATVLITFFTLERNGLIQHNKQKDDYPVAEYKAIFIEKRDDKEYRLSHKASDQTATCHQGYLFIQSDKNDGMQGLLVDYKNRGVRCGDLAGK